MAEAWHIVSGGRKWGPLTTTQLRQFARQGMVTPACKVSQGPDGPWVSANLVQGLFTEPVPMATPGNQPMPVAFGVPAIPNDESPSSKDHGERLLWQGRPSQVVNLGTFILCGLFCWLVVPVFVALWRWLEVRCMLYELTNQRFRVTHGVLGRRMDELELYRVKDMVFDQPFFLRLFSLANILIASSDIATPRAAIRALPAEEARQLRETIRGCVESLRDKKRVREVDFQ